MNTFRAQLRVGRRRTISVDVPTNEEIERIAMRMHNNGQPCLETISGWKVFYHPRQEFSMSTAKVDPFTGKRGMQSDPKQISHPSEFVFGYGAAWHVALSWKDGDDKPPTWSRDERNLIWAREHMGTSDLCVLLHEIPLGAKPLRWNLRDTYHRHHHSRMPLSETPLYLELNWRPTSRDKKRFVGIYSLNLPGLLREGFIRPESKDPKDSRVRLRIVHAEDGCFYVQKDNRGPRLLLPQGGPLAEAQPTPEAIDLGNVSPDRVETRSYRILRDTRLARAIKTMHAHCCQICGHTVQLSDGSRYAEAHHIQPLGEPHNGPDVEGNIVCVCPNHHAELDYKVRVLTISALRIVPGHVIQQRYLDYHNALLQR